MAAETERSESRPHRGRGLGASTPRKIPLRGWKDILVRVYRAQDRDQVSILAAGVAFFAFLAIVPALTAIVSVYGLFLEPETVRAQIAALGDVLPPDAESLLTRELLGLAQTSSFELSFGAILGIGFTLWSASRGIRSMMQALNRVYNLPKPRGVISLYALSLLFTLSAILFTVVVLALIVAVPIALGYLGLDASRAALISAVRWPLLAAALLTALSVIYRYGPNRKDRPGWRWVAWGAGVATLLWLGASALFSWYIASFGQYSGGWGPVGAVIVLQLWLYISAYVVLLGGEINAEAERQSAPDATP